MFGGSTPSPTKGHMKQHIANPRSCYTICRTLALALTVLFHPTFHASGAVAVEFGFGGISANVAPLNNLAVGWEFLTTKPVLFTDWGLFDVSPGGIQGTNRLSLWTASGSLLATSVMTHSTPSPQPGAFRFTPTVPLILPAGRYVISVQGSTNFFDHSERITTGLDLIVTSAPPIVYLAARYTDQRTNDSPWFPKTVAPTNRWYFGPNFQFSVLPEFIASHRLDSGAIEWKVAGEPGAAYRLQAVTDLATSNWLDVTSFVLTQATTNILDTTVTNCRQRFFRIITP
jgi:hypothetical protein